ncbi:MAG: hypothetical protein AAFW00_02935 [Bacteroidota bacterium]
MNVMQHQERLVQLKTQAIEDLEGALIALQTHVKPTWESYNQLINLRGMLQDVKDTQTLLAQIQGEDTSDEQATQEEVMLGLRHSNHESSAILEHYSRTRNRVRVAFLGLLDEVNPNDWKV